ncbi:MAG TPA: right-handed parallel beta-helix repeat-containing protein [Kofleriaceae bacterium]|nr:right-handed parallel beta-helix repeat-containing protein [Kofleriaceae bacterium]
MSTYRLVLACVLPLAACGSIVQPDPGTDPDSGTDPDGEPDADVPVDRDVPRAVTVARATELPGCTHHVDAAATGGDGSVASPFSTIGAALAVATDGAVICVAEGVYRETLSPGAVALTLAGGFRSGQGFAERDSSRFVSRAQGDGTGSFVRIDGEDAPRDAELTAIDGFEITGYERGVVRATYFSQRFALTNNYIHDNRCPAGRELGGGFVLTNVSATISGNVIARNTCGLGGGGVVIEDSPLEHSVTVERNRFEANVGDDADCHGGGLYAVITDLTVRGNDFLANRCTQWGAGLYVGAMPPQRTVARVEWNVYRDNRADNAGGGFFCDDGATCVSDHEVYDGNCGGNVFLDSGAVATVASFDHMTNLRARESGCSSLGQGLIVNKSDTTATADTYAVTNSIFWANGGDIAAVCDTGCAALAIDVSYSSLRPTVTGNVSVTFGAGNLPAVDPRFVDATGGDVHLRSTRGHWTPDGYVTDTVDSPALATGDPSGDTRLQDARAGDRTEMGAYGNSAEASYVR